MSAIAAASLVRAFGDQRAVDGVDFDVAEGEIYGFLGPNGAGKSTCIRMLCTLLRPTAGCATVAGFDVNDNPSEVRLRIGVALQDVSLDPRQKGNELLHLQARLYGLSGAQARARVTELADLVDIGDQLHDFIGTYSGGMKRRLDLAAALVHRPEILFLDEPTTGLDPMSRARVWEEVRRLKGEGITIFLTTQYLEEADELADRVGIIDRGHLITEGAPDDLKRSMGSDVIVAAIEGDPTPAIGVLEAVPGVDTVDVHASELTIRTADGSATISPVAVALSHCGVRVKNLSLRTPTLDDVFLELTGDHLEHDEDSA